MNERKGFFELGKKQIYSLNYLLLICMGNVNYYKSVHHPVPTLPVGTGSTLSTFKTLHSIEFTDISSCPNWRGKEDFFRKSGRRGPTLQHYNLVDISKEMKFEIILPLLCFLLDPLTNKHWRTWSSMINLWIDSRTCQK